MGCDIHVYREKLVDGQWVSLDNWVKEYDDEPASVPWRERYSGRNYNLFGLLCDGVRSSHSFSLKEKGFPSDASPQVVSANAVWGCDGHSHSYLTLGELKAKENSLEHLSVTVSGMKSKKSLDALMASIDGEQDTDWNLLYPYCKWSNVDEYVEFSIDVPAKFIASLEGLIALFDESSEPDSHRIVFWFDN